MNPITMTAVPAISILVLIDSIKISHSRFGQELRKLLGQCVRPDGTGNRTANGASHVPKKTQQSKHRSKLTVLCNRKDGNLLDERHRTAAYGDETLAHDYEANATMVRQAEIDHQALRQSIDGYGAPKHPLKAASVSNQQANTDQPDSSDDIIRCSDVSSSGYRSLKHHLEVGSKVTVPAVIGDLPGAVQHTSCKYGPIGKQVVRDERFSMAMMYFPSATITRTVKLNQKDSAALGPANAVMMYLSSREPLWPSPYVQDLGDRHVTGSAHYTGDDRDGGGQGVELEGAGHVGGTLPQVNSQYVGRNEVLPRPRCCDGLGDVDAMLSLPMRRFEFLDRLLHLWIRTEKFGTECRVSPQALSVSLRCKTQFGLRKGIVRECLGEVMDWNGKTKDVA
ncbi:hypothetical protein KC360_g96 [Hortaea werneckii]|nr:hypothetical protein KC344_g94 [Hortaea werneckii]KAI7180561.1 hypothetical protein KC360_g96 [Hortaea werneckii]